jgi:hypothetical protein
MKKTNSSIVCDMNNAFGNPEGNPLDINIGKLRSQTRNILDEYCELQVALGADPEAVALIKKLGKELTYVVPEIKLKDTRDALCDIHVFAYGAHHFMGIDADVDMVDVVGGVMTRFIKDEDDKQATIALHAAKGVTEVYFEGEFPAMVMKSAVDQPDAPKGKFLKSASYRDTVFKPVEFFVDRKIDRSRDAIIDLKKNSGVLESVIQVALRSGCKNFTFVGEPSTDNKLLIDELSQKGCKVGFVSADSPFSRGFGTEHVIAL